MERRLPLAPSSAGFAGAGQANAGNESRRLRGHFMCPAVATAATPMSFAQAQAHVPDSARPQLARPGFGAGPEFNETESEPDLVDRVSDCPEEAQAVRQTPAAINSTLNPADRDYYRFSGKGSELESWLDLAGGLALRILAPGGTALLQAPGPAVEINYGLRMQGLREKRR